MMHLNRSFASPPVEIPGNLVLDVLCGVEVGFMKLKKYIIVASIKVSEHKDRARFFLRHHGT